MPVVQEVMQELTPFFCSDPSLCTSKFWFYSQTSSLKVSIVAVAVMILDLSSSSHTTEEAGLVGRGGGW